MMDVVKIKVARISIVFCCCERYSEAMTLLENPGWKKDSSGSNGTNVTLMHWYKNVVSITFENR